MSMLFVMAVSASAGTVTVVISNYQSYGKGMICVVDPEFQGQFQLLHRADDFNTERTDRNSALKLLAFFKDVDQNACYAIPPAGTGRITVPDRDEVYVVTVILTTSGSATYWNITNLEGTFDQVVSVDAPSL
jgi:hypothetical protein